VILVGPGIGRVEGKNGGEAIFLAHLLNFGTIYVGSKRSVDTPMNGSYFGRRQTKFFY
jgi:hypothetical protein